MTLRPHDVPIKERVGWPRGITAISGQEVLLCSSLRCAVVSLDSGTVEWGPIVAHKIMGQYLLGADSTSPATAAEQPSVMAVASRSFYAAVWRRGDSEVRKVEARIAPVSAVALSPDGNQIAIGSGYYPLAANDYPACGVELWSLEGEPRMEAFAVLPDVIVEHLTWDAYSGLILAFTGDTTQDAGHLWLFEPPSLGGSLTLVRSAPVSERFLSCSLVSGGEMVVTVSRHRVTLRGVESLTSNWRSWDLNAEARTAAVSDERGEALVDTGEFVRFRAETVGRLDPLPGCCYLTSLPDRGWIGYSRRTRDAQDEIDVMRVWEE